RGPDRAAGERAVRRGNLPRRERARAFGGGGSAGRLSPDRKRRNGAGAGAPAVHAPPRQAERMEHVVSLAAPDDDAGDSLGESLLRDPSRSGRDWPARAAES